MDRGRGLDLDVGLSFTVLQFAIRILFSKFLAFYKRATIRAEFVFFVIDEITSIREETGDRERERIFDKFIFFVHKDT